MNKLAIALKSLKGAVKKRSPEILMGIGIAGMITTTVMAVKATPKALILIEEKKKELEVEELEPIDLVTTTWKCYVYSLAVGTISIVCLIGANSENVRRRAALATAYTLSESAFKEYQEKVVETVGEKKEEVIRDAIAKEKAERDRSESREVIVTQKGNTVCLDATFNQPFTSDIETIRRAVNNLNVRLRDEMFVSVNDFYYEIGLPPMGIGDDLGWNIDNGNVELIYSSQLTSEGVPCLVITYRLAPRYDYRNLY